MHNSYDIIHIIFINNANDVLYIYIYTHINNNRNDTNNNNNNATDTTDDIMMG